MKTSPVVKTYNGFQENTYILPAEDGSCIIIDPGCSERWEEEDFQSTIDGHSLRPVQLLNTHCHIDHVLGNAFVSERYGLGLQIHFDEQVVLDAATMVADMYGMLYRPSPSPASFLKEGDKIEWSGGVLQVLLTPGHSPGSICFYNEKDGWIIAGDVLFRDSIGRTDLPGGDFESLIRSIKTKLWPLPSDTEVYPGHGPVTTIGYEKMFNPFLQD